MTDWFKKNWKNIRYLMVHKYYVFKAGLRLKVPLWQLIIHDWSKFTRAEWEPYADFFYYRDKLDHDSMLWKLIEIKFKKAWAHHWALNPHHWEYWARVICRCNLCNGKPDIIPEKYVREMVADWIGAGYTQKGVVEVDTWYNDNIYKIKLHSETRELVDRLIAEYINKWGRVL